MTWVVIFPVSQVRQVPASCRLVCAAALLRCQPSVPAIPQAELGRGAAPDLPCELISTLMHGTGSPHPAQDTARYRRASFRQSPIDTSDALVSVGTGASPKGCEDELDGDDIRS